MLTRDSAIWTLALIASAAAYVAGHFDKFPFIEPQYQGTVEMIAFVLGLAAAKAGMSPLPKSGTGDKVDFGKIFGR